MTRATFAIRSDRSLSLGWRKKNNTRIPNRLQSSVCARALAARIIIPVSDVPTSSPDCLRKGEDSSFCFQVQGKMLYCKTGGNGGSRSSRMGMAGWCGNEIAKKENDFSPRRTGFLTSPAVSAAPSFATKNGVRELASVCVRVCAPFCRAEP